MFFQGFEFEHTKNFVVVPKDNTIQANVYVVLSEGKNIFPELSVNMTTQHCLILTLKGSWMPTKRLGNLE